MASINSSNQKKLSICCLIIAAVLVSTASHVQASDDKKPTFKQLQRQLSKAYQNAEYKKALEIAGKMHELRPGDVNTLYNTACLHCLLGNKDKAYEWLEKTIDAGYGDSDYLSNDDDFKTIRGDDRFRTLVKRARQNVRRTDTAAEQPPSKISEKPKQETPDKLSPREHQRKVGELTQGLAAASQAGSKKKALKMALEALTHAQALKKQIGKRAIPAISLTEYNVACMYSLLGEKDHAFEHLDKVLNVGWFNGNLVVQIENDSDFTNIRKDSRYAALMKRVEKKFGDIKPKGRPGEKKVDFQWNVTLPKGFDKSVKAPLVVALHHYNGNMEKTTQRWKKAAGKVGAILLTPQGTIQNSSDNYHWGRNIDTIEENIMEAINKVMDRYKIDEDKIVLAGFSQGGWVTWELAMRNPDTFCGIIPVAGRFKPASESVMTDEDLASLRVFIMVGADDNSRIIETNRQAARRFKKIGAKVNLNIYDDVGHGFPDDASAEQIKALRFILN